MESIGSTTIYVTTKEHEGGEKEYMGYPNIVMALLNSKKKLKLLGINEINRELHENRGEYIKIVDEIILNEDEFKIFKSLKFKHDFLSEKMTKKKILI